LAADAIMTARPSIGFVVHDARIGVGQGRYVVELARALSDAYDLHVFANTFDADLPPNVECHPVAAWRRTALSTVLTFLPAAERAVRRAGCDVVHAQGLTCWNADVITAHICNQARQSHAPARGILRQIFPAVVVPLERAFYRARGKRHVIAISKIIGRELAEYYGWKRPLSVIPHGVDARRFRPAYDALEKEAERRGYGLKCRDWVWLFVGEATKGVGTVIRQLEAFPLARLLVVSRSPRAPYVELAHHLGVSERLIWHGPDGEPERAYRAADVFVYPSEYDAFGMVVTEAMASGLPVVTSREIGAAELIQEGRNGLLIDPADAEGLEAAMRFLATQPERATALGSMARQSAQANSWRSCADRTAEVYDRLLSRRDFSL
jgi:UDP-glucose:(heptosyl)LPS alpha-1,3-glucosyltransferase